MDKETFRILKEINSLYLESEKLETDIKVENERLNKIETLREERKTEIGLESEKLKVSRNKLNDVENSIASFQEKLNQTESNKNNVFSEQEIESFEKQLEAIKSSISQFEDEGFEIMDNIEALEDKIRNAKTFLTGSDKTVREIQEDIKVNTEPLLSRVEILQNRISTLLEDLDPTVREKFVKIMKKKLIHGSLTSIQINHCSICKMTLSRVDIDLIEKNMKFKQCPTCSRVFVPINTQY